ncbi:DUF7563 family protein [Natronoarchaeum philippinense]|uniref:DUF7563 family protein n=1 Tax=Natronoarchaeum philippinense TaxID=558529 RepID=UPI00117C143F|nr:hypothetical protein [Natronoarchaeum philippinense]
MTPTPLSRGAHNRCLYCHSATQRKIRKLFGDNDDQLHRCPQCDTQKRLRQGSGAGVDVDDPDPVEHPERYYGNNLPPQAAILSDGGETA